MVSRKWIIVTTDRGRGDKIMLKELARNSALALVFSPRVKPIECAQALCDHQRRIARAIGSNPPPLVFYVSQTGIRAHDFSGRRARLRVLGNGTLRDES